MVDSGQPRPLVLALPKGRVLKQAVARLQQAGLALDEIDLTARERSMRHESSAATVQAPMPTREPLCFAA